MAWRGLGSSMLALWRSRELDVRTRLRILLIFVFFGGVVILHIVTPSIMTVGTFNVTSSILLNVTTIPGDISDSVFDTGRYSASAFGAISYLWSQLGTSAKLPDGVNGS